VFRQQTIGKIETGSRPPRLREADVIAAVLEVDIDVLIEESSVFSDRAALLVRHTRSAMAAWETFRDAARELIRAK